MSIRLFAYDDQPISPLTVKSAGGACKVSKLRHTSEEYFNVARKFSDFIGLYSEMEE